MPGAAFRSTIGVRDPAKLAVFAAIASAAAGAFAAEQGPGQNKAPGGLPPKRVAVIPGALCCPRSLRIERVSFNGGQHVDVCTSPADDGRAAVATPDVDLRAGMQR